MITHSHEQNLPEEHHVLTSSVPQRSRVVCLDVHRSTANRKCQQLILQSSDGVVFNKTREEEVMTDSTFMSEMFLTQLKINCDG